MDLPYQIGDNLAWCLVGRETDSRVVRRALTPPQSEWERFFTILGRKPTYDEECSFAEGWFRAVSDRWDYLKAKES